MMDFCEEQLQPSMMDFYHDLDYSTTAPNQHQEQLQQTNINFYHNLDYSTTAANQRKHHSHQNNASRHNSKHYDISKKCLRDHVINTDYKWAKNHIKNIQNIFHSMEPLWQTMSSTVTTPFSTGVSLLTNIFV
ncbi:uncharacterized protein [Montipora capricornis]|uniref:uncharacterized protein n=1 Tax=Montipora capricornis TaxID=246305 RepID=UPI0035F1895F